MDDELTRKFKKISTNRSVRAPHKPLLLLWSIGQCLKGNERMVSFANIEQELRRLMIEFGNSRHLQNNDFARDPFWLLQNDELWEVLPLESLPLGKNGRPPRQALLEHEVVGGFRQDIFDSLKSNHNLALSIADMLIEQHFCDSLRPHILQTILDNKILLGEDILFQDSPLVQSIVWRRRRDYKFRREVLHQYQFQCAVCEFSIEHPSDHYPALEAAHIQWHSHEGPDAITNGLALCSVHHELFDRGIFTIMPTSHTIRFAEATLRSPATKKLHETCLKTLPFRETHHPSAEYLNWHHEQVFQDTIAV